MPGEPAGQRFFRSEGEATLLFVRVTPRASRDAIAGVVTDAAGDERLAVRLTAVPEDGKANKALLALIARHFRIPKTAITVAAGMTLRQKTLRLAIPCDSLAETLQEIEIRNDQPT